MGYKTLKEGMIMNDELVIMLEGSEPIPEFSQRD
jgi:hypothetical protein